MSKKRKNPISRREIEPVSVTNDDRSDQPGTAISDKDKVDIPERDFLNYKKKEPMLKRLLKSKIVKGITSVIGGALGFGGSVFAGLDPEFALLVAATAVIAIFMGIEKAGQFKEIFDDDLTPKNNN